VNILKVALYFWSIFALFGAQSFAQKLALSTATLRSFPQAFQACMTMPLRFAQILCHVHLTILKEVALICVSYSTRLPKLEVGITIITGLLQHKFILFKHLYNIPFII
jgi:hypothetical protein